ncbi:MAG: ATP-binding protein [Anaerolineae bacterium]|nr:ATP-binding protein [Anaerolineae bacterium]
MNQFINREEEQTFLNGLLKQPGAHFVMVYGRRRIGKTTLLIHWAKQTRLPVFYWVAKQDPRDRIIGNLAKTIYAWQYDTIHPPDIQLPDWESALNMLALAVSDKRAIVILDELPYVLQQDAGFASHLQAAWDHRFKNSQMLLFLSGSHIGMLTEMTQYRAPLYGRLTNQFPLFPLSFRHVQPFLSRYDKHKQLAVYAILGGVPAYLERWRDNQSIAENVEQLFLQRTGWFRNEPAVLISDLTQRETHNYEAILKAIAQGHHIREDIASYAAITSTNLSHYLPRLLELQLVERRIPATVPLNQIKTSKLARYHLRDSFLRFYYRFIDPNLHLIESGLTATLWSSLDIQFRSFVGLVFENLCREWVTEQANQGQLPFMPDNVGSHWSAGVQVDVVAISWQEKRVLLGECKWSEQMVGKGVVEDLVQNKTSKLLAILPEKGEGWQVDYMVFARHAFSPAAADVAHAHQVRLITLADML